jgi:hypothetical protein
MFITNAFHEKIEITDLDAAIQQAKMCLGMVDKITEDDHIMFYRGQVTIEGYWQDIYDKLMSIKKEASNETT